MKIFEYSLQNRGVGIQCGVHKRTKLQIRLQTVYKQIADGLLHNVHYKNKKNAPKEGV